MFVFSLKHRGAKIGFGCQMVKLEDADMMAIFIYQNNDRLVSVAHSIGREHLPTIDQVGRPLRIIVKPDV